MGSVVNIPKLGLGNEKKYKKSRKNHFYRFGIKRTKGQAQELDQRTGFAN